jgi:acetoin utilization deacetylase AcuC-like enzyme
VSRLPVYFHEAQLAFKPRYEWAFGKRIRHPETTGRAESILGAIAKDPSRFQMRAPEEIPLAALRRVHHFNLLTLYTTAEQLADNEDLYPHVFPRQMRGRGDPTNLRQAGAYCFDAGTPLNRQTWSAAAWSAGCAWQAAKTLRDEKLDLVYALSRPPGHHAQHDLFGGYCYFNNAAVAVSVLKRAGRVAILDIDFHHGNGTQDLFYGDDKVLVANLHGDPRDFFPFYCGFAHETGKGRGDGYNLNVPLPGGTSGRAYMAALRRIVLPTIRHFDPTFLVLSAGLDTYEKDPMGGFLLTTDDLAEVGSLVGRLKLPTVVVQEGGYYTPHLGRNAVALLGGLVDGRKQRRI